MRREKLLDGTRTSSNSALEDSAQDRDIGEGRAAKRPSSNTGATNHKPSGAPADFHPVSSPPNALTVAACAPDRVGGVGGGGG